MIPQRVVCSGCGVPLYEGFELLKPLDVMERYNGVCPQCGKRLEFNIEKIRITPVPEEPKPIEAEVVAEVPE